MLSAIFCVDGLVGKCRNLVLSEFADNIFLFYVTDVTFAENRGNGGEGNRVRFLLDMHSAELARSLRAVLEDVLYYLASFVPSENSFLLASQDDTDVR